MLWFTNVLLLRTVQSHVTQLTYPGMVRLRFCSSGGERGWGGDTWGAEDRERSGEAFHLLPSCLGGKSLFTLQQFPVHYQPERERWPGLLDELIAHVRKEQQQLMMRSDAMLKEGTN